MKFRFIKTHCVIVCLTVTATALAAKQGKTKSSSAFPLLQENTIKSIIDVTARSVARRYDLNPEQANSARSMLEDNCWGFINKHFDSLAVLLPQMHQMRFAREEPSGEEVQAWAEKFAPIYQEAVDLVVSENDKFHKLLDDAQKKAHQRDMNRMQKDFGRMDSRLQRWRTGDYQPGEIRYGLSGRQSKARRSRQNLEAMQQSEEMDATSLSFWELYVEKFINAFQLDKGQQTLAYSVLDELKVLAQAYRKDHGREFIELRMTIAQLKPAGKSSATKPAKNSDLEKAQQKLDKLNKPLLDMFDELTRRLMDIPTDQQRKSALQLLDAQAPQQSETQPTANTNTKATRNTK